MPDRAVRKVLSYYDSTGASQDDHAAHWEGFRWTTGPWVVTSQGPWGLCRVLASSVDEGKRVIRHAASIGGWDPDDPDEGEWIIGEITAPRYGKSAEVGVKVRRGVPYVTKREGPSGAPLQ